LTAAVQLPQPGGNTPLGQFIKIGAERLMKARADQYGYGTYACWSSPTAKPPTVRSWSGTRPR